MSERPRPPAALTSDLRTPEGWERARELEDWLRASFIETGAPLHNPEHGHLEHATIGCLWTNTSNRQSGNVIAAQAEMPKVNGDMWSKARVRWLLCEWFGMVPDFVLTFDAVIWQEADDHQACALVEHELYHCSQQRNAYGMLKFSRETGLPLFCLQGHDIEEFVGVVRRYGTHVLNPKLRELVEVAQQVPAVAAGKVALACGNCNGRLVV